MEAMRMTLFRRLVQERGWTTVEVFSTHFAKAGRALAEETGNHRLADVSVARRTFDRWMAGELKRLPQRDTRSILEHLFGRPSTLLFDALPAVGEQQLEQPPSDGQAFAAHPASESEPAEVGILPPRSLLRQRESTSPCSGPGAPPWRIIDRSFTWCCRRTAPEDPRFLARPRPPRSTYCVTRTTW